LQRNSIDAALLSTDSTRTGRPPCAPTARASPPLRDCRSPLGSRRKGWDRVFFRNTSPPSHENLDVEPLDEELMNVARYLCAVAAGYLLLDAADKAACQLEQASDLLEERARVVARRETFKRLELQ
jgi:hypothetical protein